MEVVKRGKCKRFVCEEWDKRYSFNSSLKYHAITHSGVRNIEFLDCGEKKSKIRPQEKYTWETETTSVMNIEKGLLKIPHFREHANTFRGAEL